MVVAAAQTPQQAAAPTPTLDESLAEAITLVPPYAGKQRYTLRAERRVDVTRAAALLRTVLANAHTRSAQYRTALHNLETCLVLLAEDDKNRARFEDAQQNWLKVLDVCERAVQLEPDSCWAYYARGMALHNLSRHTLAATSFANAVACASNVLAQRDSVGAKHAARDEASLVEARDILYRAGYRYADSSMRLGDSKAAIRGFGDHFGQFAAPEWYEWDLHKTLGEMSLFLRDFDAADLEFKRLSEARAYEQYPDSYEFRGYTAILRKDFGAADALLKKAIERSATVQQQVYPWVFRWLSGVYAQNEHAREEAEDELAEMLLLAPLADWDRVLIAYLLRPELQNVAKRARAESERDEHARQLNDAVPALGSASDLEFLDLAEKELARRADADEDPAFLLTEAWFYVAVRREHSASKHSDGAQRAARRTEALDAFKRAVALPITEFKWEYEYARQRIAALTADLDLAASSPSLLSLEIGSERAAGRSEAAYSLILLHRVDSPVAVRLESLRDYEPRAGDYVYFVRTTNDVEQSGHLTIVP
ncbi:MAG: hypothetical protein ACKVWV_19300 [Planctomycetota bacterium]